MSFSNNCFNNLEEIFDHVSQLNNQLEDVLAILSLIFKVSGNEEKSPNEKS